MFAQILGETTCGIDGVQILVEVDVSNGLPNFELVGLPAMAVRESKERVKAALRNSHYPFPMTRITVNLAPADLRKEGSGLDLPIAIGLLRRAAFWTQKSWQIRFLSVSCRWTGASARYQGCCR